MAVGEQASRRRYGGLPGRRHRGMGHPPKRNPQPFGGWVGGGEDLEGSQPLPTRAADLKISVPAKLGVTPLPSTTGFLGYPFSPGQGETGRHLD